MSSGLFLGIDSSGTRTGIAIALGENTLAEETTDGSTHNEVMLALLETALRKGDAALADLCGIGVTIGPGMFTSLRVGLATAKALCLTHAIPLKGVNTLTALARTTGEKEQPVLAVVDARKQQVYAAAYRREEPVLEPCVVVPEELPALLRPALTDDAALVICGAADLVAGELSRAGIPTAVSETEFPSPAVVARLAGQFIEAGSSDDPAALVPLYLRKTDAELTREKNRP
jgi:tRNA threonylcarbamoyladenosine biosynthesis protein TsaB